mgnify:FL=1
MTTALKLAAAAVILAVLYTALKSWLPVWAPFIGLAGILVLFALLSGDTLGSLMGYLQDLQQMTGTLAYLCLFKSLGIILLTDYGRDMCRDAGLSAVAGCVEFGGRCLGLLTAWPLFSGVIQNIRLLAGQGL